MTILKTIKRCPNCGSINVIPDWTIAGIMYRCNGCGWKGEFILEEEIEN